MISLYVYLSVTESEAHQSWMRQVSLALTDIGEMPRMAPDDTAPGARRMLFARQAIATCDAFVGVYDQEYGNIPQGENRSIIEIEFSYAHELGKPIIVFLHADATNDLSERQKGFLDYVRQQHIIHTFTDVADLKAQLQSRIEKLHEVRRIRLRKPSVFANLRDIPPPSPTSAAAAPPTSLMRSQQQSVPDTRDIRDIDESSEEAFEQTVDRALDLASDEIQRIVRRALELHSAQQSMQQDEIIADLDGLIQARPIWGEPARRSQFQNDLFTIMPFRERFDAIYQDVVRPVAADLSLTIKRGDDFSSIGGSVIQDVWAAIYACRAVIVETTEVNANVYYELGIAHTLGKPAILLTQTADVEQWPFDIRHLRFLIYEDSPQGTRTLARDLRQRLLWILNDLEDVGAADDSANGS